MFTRLLTFKDAILDAEAQCLKADSSVILIGEGVGDPKQVFGTTTGLREKFPRQVFDMPISENGCTGVCIGAAINGFKPILVHQRMDFSLYSMDQLVNNAAKWFSMYGGKRSVPLTVRMIIGRGWGQGNQHSQNLTALYAHVPGLKIFMPSNAFDAKGMLIKAVNDPNPVLFIEHRWLYETTSEVPYEIYETPLAPTYVHNGYDVTIVASGHAMLEARKACEWLGKCNIRADLIDLKFIKPMLNIDVVINSVGVTGKLIVVDDGWRSFGIAAEVIAAVAEVNMSQVKYARLTYPDYPSGSSPALTKRYYVSAADIAEKALHMLDKSSPISIFPRNDPHDVPDANFRGPF